VVGNFWPAFADRTGAPATAESGAGSPCVLLAVVQ